MGKQINFYIDNKIEIEFIKYLLSNEYILLFRDMNDKKIKNIHDINQLNEKIYTIFLYKEGYGEILTEENGDNEIDYSKSPIIVFSRTLIKKDKKIVVRGRLWVETRYYDNEDRIVAKHNDLVKDFNKLVRWIKKNIPLQEIRKGEELDYLVKEYVVEEIKQMIDDGFRLM